MRDNRFSPSVQRNEQAETQQKIMDRIKKLQHQQVALTNNSFNLDLDT